MSRLYWLSIIVIFAAGELGAQQRATKPTFSTSTQMVLVPVTVTDHRGATIEGLRSEDFSIFDNQSAQTIVSFSNEDAASSIGLVLDISGSMQKILSAAKEIVHAFLETANPEDEFSLLTVSTEPNSLPGFTTHIDALEEEIGLTRPGGLTALIDTVYFGLSRMHEAQQPRRALLIISDGIDNHSRYSQSELLNDALEANVQVYSIIFDNGAISGASGVPFMPAMAGKSWNQARQREGPELLEKLSDRTGGLYFHVRNNAEAKEAVVKAGRALRDEYLIGYRCPPEGAESGKWHRIHVKTTVPNLRVHTRSGYRAP